MIKHAILGTDFSKAVSKIIENSHEIKLLGIESAGKRLKKYMISSELVFKDTIIQKMIIYPHQKLMLRKRSLV